MTDDRQRFRRGLERLRQLRPGHPSPSVPWSAQLVLGLGVTTLGVLFLLDNLGVLDAGDVIRLWPIIFVGIGVSQISRARTPARVVSGAIWMLAGSILLGNRLDLLPWAVWDFWPLFIVAAGGYIVWLSLRKPSAASAAEAEPGSTVSGIAVMSGFQRKVRGAEFRGAELTAFMGGCELDLREATLPEGKAAVVNIFAMMGGVALKVSESWHVVNEIVPFMGGVEDKTCAPGGVEAPRLVLRGFVMMGGVEVKN